MDHWEMWVLIAIEPIYVWQLEKDGNGNGNGNGNTLGQGKGKRRMYFFFFVYIFPKHMYLRKKILVRTELEDKLRSGVFTHVLIC